MRIGINPIISEVWRESQSNGYKVLFPPTYRLDLLQQLYKNWDFVFQYNSFSNGVRVAENGSSGFSSAIDKTRDDCKWSTELFPPQNGWGKSLPVFTPADAKEATDISGLDITKTIRLIAWRAINIYGKQQLIVRIGDPANNNNVMLVDDHRFYVTQDGKTVSAVSGLDFQSRASVPTVLALNGDFDASRSFILTLYGFHFHTTDERNPIATVTFD
jgi:hypothetical protein